MSPTPWPSSEPKWLATDVLVVGGGVAGCLAAIQARDEGAAVLVADKAKFLERAGSVAGGVDQFMTPLNTEAEWDSPEHLMKFVPGLTDGLSDLDVAERAVHELPRVFQRLCDIGIDFTDPTTGEYFRTRAFGLPGEYHLNFDGSRFKYKLGRYTVGHGAKFLPRTMITDLVTDAAGERVVGAVGFNCRTGERYVIRARSVVVCTGDINRISRNISGMPFDSWHFPYNTGDGHAMAFRHGVRLTNMELVEATLTPLGFSVQGTNSYAGQGAYFLNRHGERFMFKYDPKGEKARRTILVNAVIEEVLAGNEPLYIDIRHLPEEQLDDFVRTLGVDRYTLPGYFAQRNLDIRKELLPFGISEMSIRRGGSYFRGSGLVVDTSGQTNLTGLYSAGDCSMVSGGISVAAAMGAIAGRGAVESLGAAEDEDAALDPGSLDTALARMEEPLLSNSGRRWSDFEDDVRALVTDFVGMRRTEKGLRHARERLRALAAEEGELDATGFHELMRTLESKSIRLAAELMTEAALHRTESRSGAAHRRLDHPETDDLHWKRAIVLRQSAQGELALESMTEREPEVAVGGQA
ncbi:FAD-binding protein [Nocardioides caldifontis]|uniref:FAD-binding protein n=1 Tax=Nocardioides caldifontis TaxID=2588938 RepID=UPI0011DFAB0A|nr:FAD-binding protein [Nocardioides caldifontis]